MREVPPSITNAWLAEDKTGDKKPVVRATISKTKLKKYAYDTHYSSGGDITWEDQPIRVGYFTTTQFGVDTFVREIRNIRSYHWNRSVDQDVATCTLTILNSEMKPMGEVGPAGHASDFDLPGYYTYDRGGTSSSTRWGYAANEWGGLYIPDRIVKTYEGYGQDLTLAPGMDPHLIQSGTWLIDTVSYSADGTIELTMRDLGRLLLDQMVFPPVVPYEDYPMSWSTIRSELVPGREPTGGSWSGALVGDGTASSSNTEYDAESGYVTADGTVEGHKARDAVTTVDENIDTEYWLSTGQADRYDMVWWEFAWDGNVDLSAFRMSVKGGPYRMFISLKGTDGQWKGKRKIDYTPTTKGVDIGAKIPFIASRIADRGKPFDLILKRPYANIKKVRVTLTRLTDTKTPVDYPWKAGIKRFQAYTGDIDDLDYEQGENLRVVGNYKDYTDVVKWIVCWGGFYWPGLDDWLASQQDQDYIKLGWSTAGGEISNKRWIHWAHRDPRLPKGRAWGDFMNTGTAGEVDLTVDMFDKQPLMDVINYVRDLTGFLFFIDEQGAVVWRMPNIYKKGNYLSPVTLGAPTRARSTDYVSLDEEATLLTYQINVSSESNREVIFVANLIGEFGTAIRGYAPANAELRRTAGWTDQKFDSKKETRIMADLIATQQMFAYRRGQATIPGNPAIQIDDQVRIWERVTNETFYHYVLGIEAELNMEEGTFTYSLDTHWLGESESSWMADTVQRHSLTQAYLNELGMEDSNNGVSSSTEDE